MTMTAAQLAEVRDCIGDHDPPFGINDTDLHAIFDDATMGNSSTDRTKVFALRRLLGRARRLVALSGEFGNAQHQMVFEQTKRLLADWEGRVGLHGGVMVGGAIDLGIDQNCPDGMTCTDD